MAASAGGAAAKETVLTAEEQQTRKENPPAENKNEQTDNETRPEANSNTAERRDDHQSAEQQGSGRGHGIPVDPAIVAVSDPSIAASYVTPPIAAVPNAHLVPGDLSLPPGGQHVVAVVEIPNETIGWIIGKQGEVIRELMAKSGTSMEIDRGDYGPGHPTRALTVAGLPHQVEYAQALIRERMIAMQTGRLDREPVLEMWIPFDRVGMIIGARGAVIRSLQERTGSTIIVHNDKVNHNQEKLLTLSGTREQAAAAQALIGEILQKPRSTPPTAMVSPPGYYGPAYGSQSPYAVGSPFSHPGVGVVGNIPGMSLDAPTTSRTIFVPSSCVGVVIGKRGDTIRELQERSGAHIKVTPDREAGVDAPERMITITGSPTAIDLAHHHVNEVVQEGLMRQKRAHAASVGTGQAPAPKDGREDVVAQQQAAAQVQGAVTATVEVPNDKVGLVIGRQGMTIRELQLRSGARIVVTKEEENAPEKENRLITVSGTSQCVDHAKALINERIRGASPFPVGATYQQKYPQAFGYPSTPAAYAQASYGAYSGAYGVPSGYHIMGPEESAAVHMQSTPVVYPYAPYGYGGPYYAHPVQTIPPGEVVHVNGVEQPSTVAPTTSDQSEGNPSSAGDPPQPGHGAALESDKTPVEPLQNDRSDNSSGS
eukprot:CAMPEP_0198369940 /NCGR_PEP_ID=MMETSP1450-20131203/156464_1 /TAXON_ID=753684 ORGANISM="Madagascaria erythrocladiodes, Strain CCMP3234" /NCGR_SAMPLE_ID=MMETSP1450 /ASSEMBLY_ACC=CAM_ASM_001115 /LENGTH=653 /DNA_ID=CAMNT_0044077471 /DNA_START=448 /DNA_END=2409 /DNA_ORIENTATION=+